MLKVDICLSFFCYIFYLFVNTNNGENMNKKDYKELTSKINPKTRQKKLFISFFVGGLIGVIGQILVTIYSKIDFLSKIDSGNLMMVTLIFISSLLTAIGCFDNLVTKFEAGLIVPITGFSHSTTSSALEYRKEGLVYGIGSNIFKLSGSVILYGIVSASIFGIIRYIIFGG